MAKLDFILPEGDFAQQLETIIRPAVEALEERVSLTLPDGAELATRMYAVPNAKAVVCICHGFTEFAEKYQEIVYNFTRTGYAVVICDHRGHGFSTRMVDDPYKVHIDSYNTYVSDFDCMVQYAAQRFPALPMLLFCHSMGGCIGALYLQTHPKQFAGAVLSSPMMEINSGIAPTVGWLYARQMVKSGHETDCFDPKAGAFNGIRKFEGSSCADQGRFDAWFDKRVAEPRYQTNNGTLGWLRASLEAQSRAVLRAGRVKTPVLLCQAGKDHLVLPGGQERFVQRAQDARLVLFPRARHEIFNSGERIRRAYWSEILNFYEQVPE